MKKKGDLMRRILKLSLSAALSGGALTGAAVASPAVAGASVVAPPGGAIIVGTASATCVSPSYATIQPAISAASPGATIYVCAGTYSQSVSINKPLTLLGAQYGVDGVGRSGQPETVIDTTGGISYAPGATTGTVSGFTLNGYTGTVGEIQAANVGSAWTFTDNIMDVSNGGIYFNTDSVATPGATTIADNEFTQSVGSDAGSGDYGQAVLIWQKAGDNVSIQDNDFSDLSGPGAEINTTGSYCATSSTGLSISDNTSEANGAFYGDNLVALFCATGASITGNTYTVTDSDDANAAGPVFLGGGNHSTVVSGNTFIGNGAPNASAIGVGTANYANDDNTTVENNTVTGWGENGGDGQGIVVYGTSSSFTIEGNSLTDNGDGIWITPAYGGTPSGTVTGNYVHGSITNDCQDDTSGSGTSGTNDTWSDNDGVTSAPGGLCGQTVVVNSADVVPYPTAPSTGQFVAINQGGTSDGSGVSVVSSGPTPSQGSLQLTTTTSASHWAVYNEDHGGTPLADITALSYSTYSNDPGNTEDPGLQLVIDPGNTVTPDAGVAYSTLNFEPYLQAGGQTADTWQTWNVMAGVVWGSHLTGATEGSPISWSTFVSRYPHATILSEGAGGGVGVNVGSGWTAMTGKVGALTFGTSAGTTTYVFDPTAPSTSTTTTPTNPSIVFGNNTTDGATVTGNAVVGSPTGTVSFYECGPTPTSSPCTSVANPVGGAVGVTAGPGSTSTANSVSFTPPSAGTWCFSGHYSGDSNYALSSDTSTDECFTVGQATPSTPTISNPPGSGTYGGSFVPTVSTDGDGTTSVTSSTSPVCTVSAGTVDYVGVGTCTLTAHVADGTDYSAADGSPQSFAVGQASTNTKTTPTDSTITLGQADTDLATVTGNAGGGSPTGTVTFYECGPASVATPCTSTTNPVGGAVNLTAAPGDTSAATSTSFTPTAVGYWCFAGHYSGDANYQASSDTTVDECVLVQGPPTVVTTSLPGGTKGVHYSSTLAARGGKAPYTWSHTGKLPRGVTLSRAGVLSGTPTKSGTFTFVVKVKDSSKPREHATRSLTLVIAP
jgi:parallel beta-helix repeat protein